MGGTRTDAQLDELIPPPWPPRRRVVAALLVGAVVVGGLLMVRSGAVVPRLVHGGGWGSSVDAADPDHLVAERLVPIHNAGWTTATIESWEPPPVGGVQWGDVEGLPVTLGPGESVEVAVGFTVDGCDVDAAGVDGFPFRASGPLGPTVTVTVGAIGTADPRDRTTYLDDDGQGRTLPVWPDQEPSWILDVIHAACASPPDEIG